MTGGAKGVSEPGTGQRQLGEDLGPQQQGQGTGSGCGRRVEAERT